MQRPRVIGLDLLRLVAIVLVLGRHAEQPPAGVPLASGLVESWQRGGWVGVDLFFVLSGFLVSGLLFAEFASRGQISVLRFYVRRGWRIYPAFYLLIATTILGRTVFFQAPSGRHVLAEVFFLQSYATGLWNHTWSLAVEEH